ncbi:acetylornithine deacetylase/succinyl-diaminopimelate desuccinylase-like protein [Arthrobacter sp. PvP102]|uniref:hypothetical protein n=1 Tax=unclassified Arthrobacter TaxID=235627 RepID=UPI001AEA9681|nr:MULTISPECIES: hypothetical protein [unclassified Arthrobacter]MBP1235205.1 acetylornithine deacetylase/succinyl-diaminopimelate desuccinylase-like protein [Arthrobacter sp. PvP103]MBP1236164.1 acetylornithine deacetylase/succinyl-diaminopimelate desuccinylase-like protein [Arthrobacter sp. PvP102]
MTIVSKDRRPVAATSAVQIKTVATPPELPVEAEEPKTVAEPLIVAEQPQPASPEASGSVEQIVRAAARKFGLDENYSVGSAMCKSTMNPNAVNYGNSENGNPSGLFQHLSGYWPARAN